MNISNEDIIKLGKVLGKEWYIGTIEIGGGRSKVSYGPPMVFYKPSHTVEEKDIILLVFKWFEDNKFKHIPWYLPDKMEIVEWIGSAGYPHESILKSLVDLIIKIDEEKK